jgi:hypothetical protein
MLLKFCTMLALSELQLKEKLAGSSEAVASGELPHARKELGETTAEESHANDDVGSVNATCTDIVQRQNERRGGKRVETTIEMQSGSALG